MHNSCCSLTSVHELAIKVLHGVHERFKNDLEHVQQMEQLVDELFMNIFMNISFCINNTDPIRVYTLTILTLQYMHT